ncbi:MAG: FHA domain-containing protein [Ruminiclostridium sp.]|nr:FHA domain-containing protein [Ruminiclostridium sp.]
MGYTTCPNGHLYDPEQYASCPHCNGGSNMIDFTGGGYPQGTIAPGSFGGDYPQGTVAPNGFGGGGVQNEKIMGTHADPSAGFNPDEVNKTVAPSDYSGGPSKTIAVFEAEQGFVPVVGWLVCTEGNKEEKGKSFNLLSKRNKIGRDRESDVRITGDNAISGYNASIAFDEEECSFTLIPSDTANNVRINGKAVYVPTTIVAYDEIRLGVTHLVFVPFCSERFSWGKKAEDKV